jgi:hypothetical protein
MKKRVREVDATLLGDHRVFYRASQVERSVPCYFAMHEIKVGLRLAVLEERNEFFGTPPTPHFYTGQIEKISETGLVTIAFDAHPYATALSADLDQIMKFCIRIPRLAPHKRSRKP